MDLKLKNKRVLILGSSSGLGYATAKSYADEGAIVAMCSRDKKRIEAAAQSIPHSFGFVCDLNQIGEGTKLVEQVQKTLGGIDILMTNSGGPPKGAFSDLKVDDWQEGFQGLWLSIIECILATIPGMKQNRFGRIILNTSTAAKEPIPNLTVSNGLRAGLLGLMKTLSVELAPYQITVNALLPGYTKTERLAELKVSETELLEHIPLKRLGKPEEFAALATFLGSECAGYITGQAIACDGGLIKSF